MKVNAFYCLVPEKNAIFKYGYYIDESELVEVEKARDLGVDCNSKVLTGTCFTQTFS